MTNSTKALIGVLLAGTAGLIIFLFVHLSNDPGKPISIGSQKAAAACTKGENCLPDLTFTDVNGTKYTRASLVGKVVVVNFWATWCAPCREEMPEFIKAQQQHGAQGLQFVGIAVDQADKVEQFAKEIGLNYPTLIGGFGAMELSKSLGNKLMALPFTVVLDRKGEIVHTQLGELKPAKLQSIITQLL